MEIPCDDADRRLFAAATTITVEDGNKAKFWSAPYLDGIAPQIPSSEHISNVQKKEHNS